MAFEDNFLDESVGKTVLNLDFSIKLPEFQQTFLSALSYGSDHGAYVSFDSDTTHCVVDNCANVHIWNNINDFVQGSYIEFDQDKSTGVSAVNGSTNKPAGIGNVRISWHDDKGKKYEIELRNVLHFPSSPVKILSVVELAAQLGDDWDTWILSRRYQSTFTWAFGKFVKTIPHLKSRLPELQINSGDSAAKTLFCLLDYAKRADPRLLLSKSFMTEKKVHSDSEKIVFATNLDFKDDSADYDEFNNYCKPITPSTKIPVLKLGASVRYILNDHVEKGIITQIDVSDPIGPPLFEVTFDDGRKSQCTKEHIKLVDDPEQFAIPTTATQLLETTRTLSKEQLEALINPDPLTPLQKLWVQWHDFMDHLPFPIMNRCVIAGILPKKFACLRNWKYLCPSCLLSRQRKRYWQSKSKVKGTLRPSSIKNSGDCVSIDHLISAKPGLIPRICGKHTQDRICAAVIFKDHVSDFNYTHLMTSCNLEETIAAKHAFEKLAATYNV